MWKVGIEVRKDMTAGVLRKKARSEKDGRIAARMLGIANILEGMDRTTAAQASGMDRQTLCDWVHRYNEEGLAGLANRPKGRSERQLTPDRKNARFITAIVLFLLLFSITTLNPMPLQAWAGEMSA